MFALSAIEAKRFLNQFASTASQGVEDAQGLRVTRQRHA